MRASAPKYVPPGRSPRSPKTAGGSASKSVEDDEPTIASADTPSRARSLVTLNALLRYIRDVEESVVQNYQKAVRELPPGKEDQINWHKLLDDSLTTLLPDIGPEVARNRRIINHTSEEQKAHRTMLADAFAKIDLSGLSELD